MIPGSEISLAEHAMRFARNGSGKIFFLFLC